MACYVRKDEYKDKVEDWNKIPERAYRIDILVHYETDTLKLFHGSVQVNYITVFEVSTNTSLAAFEACNNFVQNCYRFVN